MLQLYRAADFTLTIVHYLLAASAVGAIAVTTIAVALGMVG